MIDILKKITWLVYVYLKGKWVFAVWKEKGLMGMAQLEVMDKSLFLMVQMWDLIHVSEDHVMSDVIYLTKVSLNVK